MLQNITRLSTLLFATALLMLSNCKTPKLPAEQALLPVPDNFQSQTDTLNTASISWSKIFNDPYLTALIEEALQNNQDMQTAAVRIQMANTGVKAAKGALKPFVSGGATPNLRKFGLYTMDGAGNATTDIEPGRIVPVHLPDLFVGLQSSWEVDAFKKLRNQKKAALLQYFASQEGRNLVQANLVAEISLAYFSLMAIDGNLEVLREALALQQQALDIVITQKEAGTANELAVKQFQAQVLNAQAALVEFEQAKVETENLLNFLAGRYPQPIQRDSQLLNKTLPTILSGVPAQLLLNRPDIRQAELELKAAHADVLAARAAFFPTITITGMLGTQAFDPALLLSPQSLAYWLFGSVMQPIFNRSAIEAEYEMATALQRDGLLNYQKAILAGTMEVNNEISRIKNLEKMIGLKVQEAELLRSAIDISNELYRYGKANYLELLATQQNFLEARLSLLELKTEQFEASVNLYKALGGGWR